MNKLLKVLLKIFIVFPIIFIILDIFVGELLGNRGWKSYDSIRSKMKSCFSNQRIIYGAVEMYNMDKDDPKEYMKTLDQDELVRGGYLKKNLNHAVNESCVYRDNGDLTGEGIVYCEYHGQSDPLGKIKPSKKYEWDEWKHGFNIAPLISLILAVVITWII